MQKVMLNGQLVEVTDFGDEDAQGRFLRQPTRFRDRVSADGSSPYPAEAGRYHLYVSYACPWAHRTLIVRKLKKLEPIISISVVDPVMGPESWRFGACDGCSVDHLFGSHWLYEVYLRAAPDFSGTVTVPVLFDRKTNTIVNNESAEIMRMLNSAFDAFGDASVDLYPEPLRPAIDAINREVYEQVNDGVYRAGFARTQAAYEEAFDALFAMLDRLEQRLAAQRYLVGPHITEADWRLFTTLLRFDAVYYTHFKCNLRRIVDYPNLWNYLRDLYQRPGIRDTVRFDHIKPHYYRSHLHLNPRGFVPKGPQLDFDAPHDRARLADDAGEPGM